MARRLPLFFAALIAISLLGSVSTVTCKSPTYTSTTESEEGERLIAFVSESLAKAGVAEDFVARVFHNEFGCGPAGTNQRGEVVGSNGTSDTVKGRAGNLDINMTVCWNEVDAMASFSSVKRVYDSWRLRAADSLGEERLAFERSSTIDRDLVMLFRRGSVVVSVWGNDRVVPALDSVVANVAKVLDGDIQNAPPQQPKDRSPDRVVPTVTPDRPSR